MLIFQALNFFTVNVLDNSKFLSYNEGEGKKEKERERGRNREEEIITFHYKNY